MERIGAWLAVATDRTVVRQAAATGVLVGTLLAAINHGQQLLAGELSPEIAWEIALSFAVPYVVATVTSYFVIARQRRHGALADPESYRLLEREIEAINKFPDQNPNPVMRATSEGHLIYANAASAPIVESWGVAVGQDLATDIFSELVAGGAAAQPRPVEVSSGNQTYAVLAVTLPELGVVNLYGTDITAAKAVAKFPDRNPNPVLRVAPDGTLIYANAASAPIIEALGIALGDRLPTTLGALGIGTGAPGEQFEVRGAGREFIVLPVPIPEFGFTNLYGTDVTALHAINKFPDENPNPVLRLSRDGILTYRNPASSLVCQALGVAVGDQLSPELFGRIQAILDAKAPNDFEVEAEGRIFTLRIVSLFEFESINLYGTDITAARQVERANQENERLLLNILPASVADRLRHGEVVIADRFDEMAVLFADIVGFTPFAAKLLPQDLVAMLNVVFSIFDRLTDRYELEKIKTIGDAYMVVGGLTTDGTSSVERVAEMGLEMIAELDRYRTNAGERLQIRVGMHVGPVIGGVIGIKKFIYDVWGDTVNTASRMESHGVPGRLHVSEATYERLKGAFAFEPRGEIEVKGRGRMSTYFLLGQHRGARQAGDRSV